MTKVERQMDQLYSVLKKSKQLSLSESMELLQVSESTIRRLFIALEKKRCRYKKIWRHPIISDTINYRVLL